MMLWPKVWSHRWLCKQGSIEWDRGGCVIPVADTAAAVLCTAPVSTV